MSGISPTFESLIESAKQLSPVDKLRLIEGLLPDLEASIKSSETQGFESLYGILSSFGPAPSAEDIEEVRREMFRDFPRTDIA